MSKLLTPPEVVQAILGGKRVEIRGVIASQRDDWKPLNEHEIHIGVLTNGLFVFRLAQEQEMVTIGDVSFPKPESDPPKQEGEYYIPNLHYVHSINLYIRNRWVGDFLDARRLERGLVHLSQEDAISHAKALIKLNGGTIDE